jgi:hypothetical protein
MVLQARDELMIEPGARSKKSTPVPLVADKGDWWPVPIFQELSFFLGSSRSWYPMNELVETRHWLM